MAKRKPAPRRTTPRGTATSRARATRRATSKASRGGTARSTAKTAARTRARAAATGARTSAGRAGAAGRKRATSTRSRSPAARRTAPGGRTGSGTTATKKLPSSARPAAPRAAASTRTAPTRPVKVLPRGDSPARRRQIERDRRLIEETLPMPPSTLDLDRHPSAARSGRAELAEARGDHNAADPGIAGGDVDADWASAYSTGDEAPGGDMPTPDQDVVEEIGSALGVKYADGEELKGANKILQRDRHRWELDPASAEDYQDRSRQK